MRPRVGRPARLTVVAQSGCSSDHIVRRSEQGAPPGRNTHTLSHDCSRTGRTAATVPYAAPDGTADGARLYGSHPTPSPLPLTPRGRTSRRTAAAAEAALVVSPKKASSSATAASTGRPERRQGLKLDPLSLHICHPDPHPFPRPHSRPRPLPQLRRGKPVEPAPPPARPRRL